jgi:hypothetical protein
VVWGCRRQAGTGTKKGKDAKEEEEEEVGSVWVAVGDVLGSKP